MKKILLTGANGFIGKHLLDKFVNNGHYVVAPVRVKSAETFISNIGKEKNIKIVPGNFYDDSVLEQLFKTDYDAVFHFASIRGSGKGDWHDYEIVNVTGTEKLLEYTVNSGIEKFVYCSSVGVLGTIPISLPAKPGDKANPDGFYHKSKYLAEEILNNFDTRKTAAIILRPTVTYGKSDNGFTQKMINLMKKKRMFIPQKSVKIHLLSVGALAHLCENILKSPVQNNKIYHVADSEAVSLKDLCCLMQEQILNNAKFYRIPDFLFDAILTILYLFGEQKFKTSFELISKDWFYDISDTKDVFNYKPVSTLEAIKESINF